MSILNRIAGATNTRQAATPVAGMVQELASTLSVHESTNVGAKLRFEHFATGEGHEAAHAVENRVHSLREAASIIAGRFGSSSLAMENYAVRGNERVAVPGQEGEAGVSLVAAALAGTYADVQLSEGANRIHRQLNMESFAGQIAGQSGGRVFRVGSGGLTDASMKHGAEYAQVASKFFSNESYAQPQGLRNSMIYSMAYNFFAVGQDEFSESLYPTIVIAPDQVGVGIEASVMTVFEGVRHTANTTADDFKKRLLVRSRRHPEMLAKDSTTVVPAAVPAYAGDFVDPAIFPARVVKLDKVDVTTNYLRPGANRNLLLLSGTQAMIGDGVQTQEDSLEPAVLLKAIGVKIGESALSFSTLNIPGNQFAFAQQGNDQQRNLTLHAQGLVLTEDSKDVTGAALDATLKAALTGLTANLELIVTGSVNIESGMVNAGLQQKPTLRRLIDNATKTEIGKGDARFTAIDNILKTFNSDTDFGYEVQAFRSNAQLRLTGQLIDRMTYTQLYDVPLRAPITAKSPIMNAEQNLAENTTTLLATTRSRLNGELVTSLFEHLAQIREYKGVPLRVGEIPEVLGAGRFSLLPYHADGEIDVSDALSLDEADRRQNISSRIVNFLKDKVYEAYMQSEFQAAADQKFGGIAPKPTVVIATDIRTASYITIPGDTRTMGDQFDFRVVTTLDARFDNRIVVVFNYLDGTQNSAVNELNFGNLFWSAEQVIAAQVSENTGATSHRVTVQPRYRFINHAPIGMEFTVKGIPEALNAPFLVKTAPVAP